jgi:LacI family gluconate utilization system Gnt-I transcriptional repressor
MPDTLKPFTPPARATRGAGVTAHDVARLAGVSAITVSRALNTPGQVSQATLQRVREAIEQTGYVPNLLAKSLNANKSARLVAAVVPTISGPIFSASVQALTQALAAHDYQLMLGQTGYEDSREDALLDAIIGRRPDGIVLTGVMHSAGGRKRLLASGIPVVETWDLTDDPIDMLVGFSHEAVGREVCDFLYAQGRRRPGLVTARDQRAVRRNRAFAARAAELGLRPVPMALAPAPGTLGGGRACLDEMLHLDPRVDSVFCSSDMLALGVLTEAQARGLTVPEGLAVVGFGDLEFSADVHPALTTVHIDGNAIGGQAARFIVQRAENALRGSRIVDVGFTIVVRQSA